MVEIPKKLLLQNQRPMTLGFGMWHWECRFNKVDSNDYSRLTLTYFMTRSIVLQMHFNGNALEKLIFQLQVNNLGLYTYHLLLYIFIDKYIRSGFTGDLSTKSLI